MLEQYLIAGGVVVLWVVCGALSFGNTLAYFQREFPRIADQRYVVHRRYALEDAILGPFGLLAGLLVYGIKHGLLFRRPTATPDATIPDRAQLTISTLRAMHDAMHGLDGTAHRLSDKPREGARPLMDIWRVYCPLCDEATPIRREEVEDHSASCTECRKRFDPHTGKALEQEGGEPAWDAPSDADRAWALATMPGRATGHVLAWRIWEIRHNPAETAIDDITTESLLGLPSDQAWQRLFSAYADVEALRRNPPARYLLESCASDHVWQPHEPVVAVREDRMPIAYGAGVYATKEPTEEMVEPVLSGPTSIIIGQVALWGEVVEHEHGYRARYAYPVRVWVPEKIRADNLVFPHLAELFREQDHESAQAVADELSRVYGIEATAGLPDEVRWLEQMLNQREKELQRRDDSGPGSLAPNQPQFFASSIGGQP